MAVIIISQAAIQRAKRERLEDAKTADSMKWTDEPIDDTGLCGSCRFGKPSLSSSEPETNGRFVWCNLWTDRFTIDDGCTAWKRKVKGN